MADLWHEIWLNYVDYSPDPCLPGCCLAGPDGDGFRGTLHPEAKFLWTFKAGSHFRAMTIYYRLVGYEEVYTTSDAWDLEPYPIEWAERQKSSIEM